MSLKIVFSFARNQGMTVLDTCLNYGGARVAILKRRNTKYDTVRQLMCKVPVILCVFILALAASSAAQNKTASLNPPPPLIKIEGYVAEWEDSLRYYDADTKLNYTLAK